MKKSLYQEEKPSFLIWLKPFWFYKKAENSTRSINEKPSNLVKNQKGKPKYY